MTNERIERAETRRHFLGIAAASAAAAVAGCNAASAAMAGANGSSADAPAPWSGKDHRATVTSLSEHLLVYHGPINVGIVRDGDKALLIDCGDGSVAEALPQLGITSVEQVLFTHHHRDQACGAHACWPSGARIGVPAAERG